ncbi:IS200/IS605 family transposase [Leptolyngbya sp. AN03gr2]|uniref:IS200/IS605 family transposase n=1 Tax=unclassified Leptolyngbya TaxID=2650499 RepID=UPI003D3139E0
MALWKLHYHLVWATKNRQPLITPTREPELYQYLQQKTNALNCICHAVGGMADHIHLIVSIPPTLAISDYVCRVKGGSSHYVNHSLPSEPLAFAWQLEYGVFSMGESQSPTAIAYVQNQKRHHENGSLIRALEIHLPPS